MRLIFLSFILFGISGMVMGQNSGYYRSKMSGHWDNVSTWETSPDSINWQNASAAPDFNSKYIVVSGGDTVSVLKTVAVNQTVIDSGAFLIVNGPGADSNVTFHIVNGAEEIDMKVYGTVMAAGIPDTVSPFSVNAIGVLSFEPGSVYEHKQNGGGIPFSTWKQGSTMKLTGTVNLRPSNRAQDYSNIIVDLPNLMVNLNMGFNENIISGDITIFNTNQYRWVLVGPTSNETRTVTIMGNIYLHQGNFNTHGTENPNSVAIVHTYGDIIVTGGNFSIARASQGFTGTTTWYLHGDLSISNATTQNANPVGAKFVYTGPGEHKLILENVTFGPGGLPIEVDTVSLNIGTSVLKDSGMFNLTSGSVLICANKGGLDSALQNLGPINLSMEADYVFNGIEAEITGEKLPVEVHKLVVNNPSEVMLSHDVKVNDMAEIAAGNLILGGRILTLGENAVLSETGGTAAGSTGKIITTRNINAPDTLNVGNIGAAITTNSNLGITTIERYHFTVNLNGTNSISRVYYIGPENNSGLNASLRIYYNESELDTISENNLGLYISQTGGANTWEFKESTINTENNYAEISGLDYLAYITLGYSNRPVSVENENETPILYSLYQNYPNPFNPETIINFDIPENSFVNLSIYNTIGEKVITLIDQDMEKGKYSRTFNAQNLPSGIYIYRMSSGNAIFIRKMMLLK